MVPDLAVLNWNSYAKREFIACGSSAIKQICLPLWEAATFTPELSILVGGFVQAI